MLFQKQSDLIRVYTVSWLDLSVRKYRIAPVCMSCILNSEHHPVRFSSVIFSLNFQYRDYPSKELFFTDSDVQRADIIYLKINSLNLLLGSLWIFKLDCKTCSRKFDKMSQLMRFWYLSHRRPAKAQARVRLKIRHLAPLDGCACVFEECIYRGQKVPKSHELAQIIAPALQLPLYEMELYLHNLLKARHDTIIFQWALQINISELFTTYFPASRPLLMNLEHSRFWNVFSIHDLWLWKHTKYQQIL